MKRRRFWITLVLAAVSGSFAAYFSIRYVRSQADLLDARAGRQPDTRAVAVATRGLARGKVIRPEDVRLVDWPAAAVPSGYVTTPSDLVGRGVINPIHANEPLLRGDLADKEAGGGLPIAIPEGMRAVSVPVDEVVGVAGFVLPGTRVDVIVTLSQRAERRPVSRTVLQNILTLASNQSIQAEEDGEPQNASVITLLVMPEEAELLTLAANQGSIQLALRNTLDLSAAGTPGARLPDLVLGSLRARDGTEWRTDRSSPASGRPVRPGPTATDRYGTVVELFRGSDRSEITF